MSAILAHGVALVRI